MESNRFDIYTYIQLDTICIQLELYSFLLTQNIIFLNSLTFLIFIQKNTILFYILLFYIS